MIGSRAARPAWLISGLVHLGLAAIMLTIHLHLPEPLPELARMHLLDPVPDRAGSTTSPPSPAPEPERPALPAPESARTGGAAEEGIAGRLGIRSGLNWVSGPPNMAAPPLDLERLVQARSTPIRRTMAPTSLPTPGERAFTLLDTLVYAQQRLAELAGEWMAEARAAPGTGRWAEPYPVPGSIQELRGEPQLPLLPLAAAAAELLVEIGTRAWNKLVGHDPSAAFAPELDLTTREATAYGALREHRGITLFEWHARLPMDWEGGLGDLQHLATRLAEKNMVVLQQEEQVFRYRRLVPLDDVIAYYTSFLNRLPEGSSERGEELIRILSLLVRDP